MRCTILAIGSRSDVQPLIALGVGLKTAGLDVRFATHLDVEAAAHEHGLEFFPLAGNSEKSCGGHCQLEDK